MDLLANDSLIEYHSNLINFLLEKVVVKDMCRDSSTSAVYSGQLVNLIFTIDVITKAFVLVSSPVIFSFSPFGFPVAVVSGNSELQILICDFLHYYFFSLTFKKYHLFFSMESITGESRLLAERSHGLIKT